MTNTTKAKYTQPLTLIDSYGRQHRSLRLSVTDRCNLRCGYCMPEDHPKFKDLNTILTIDDYVWLVQIMTTLGITNIRLTGGEPLLRKGIIELVERLAQLDHVEDLSMTTNGMLLQKYAKPLADAGLNRINVSLDSLDPQTFESITRYGVLDKVWAGIDAALEAGIEPLKLNVLALGWLEETPQSWLTFIKHHHLTVRLMELMPIGKQAPHLQQQFINLTQLRTQWQQRYNLKPDQRVHRGNGPATYWTLPQSKGSIGFITPMSKPYCQSCSRLRISADGRFFPCLAFESHVNFFEAIKRRDTNAVIGGVLWGVQEKPRGHHWQEGIKTSHSMFSLGG